MRRARAQRGFTLIEIMIALVISTLLVAMIISIFTSMSAAYRTQQQVAELQQILQAAQVTVEGDLRQAGYRCPQGFTWAGSATVPISPLRITDGGTGPQQPDQLAIFYGDPSAQAQVLPASLSAVNLPVTSVQVDAIDPTWTVGDLALLSVQGPSLTPVFETGVTRPPEEPPPGDNNNQGTVSYYFACVVQIAGISGNTITFSTAAPWGSSTNTQCYKPRDMVKANGYPAMLYRFVARAYRIDPTRKDLSVFQQSPSGALVANDWTDLGLGFTNFQIASRWYYSGTGYADNADTDTDGYRNWYSSTNQNALSAADTTYGMHLGGSTFTDAIAVPLQVSVSFVVRTTRHVVDGTVTSATPALQDPANLAANDVGDSPSVQLAGVADSSRPQELRGDNIYRYATIKVDTRNLGVNR